MLSIRRALRALTLAAATGIVAACGDSTGADTGRLSIKLTDAPGDIEAAVVTIDRIYLQGGDGEDGGGRVILRDTPITTDLLTLRDSIADIVEDAVVPSGTYHQLRFVISGAYIEVENESGGTSIFATSPSYAGLPAGATVAGELRTPSWDASGFKVKLPGDRIVIDGDQKILLVDFDVSRSFFRELGNGNWIARPNLEATEFVATGTLSTTVTKADTVTFPTINGAAVSLAGFTAVLAGPVSGAREERALADANGDGVYEADFRFLVPGSYTLDFRAPSDSITFTTSPGRPLAVTVGSGGVATRAVTVTSARK